MNDESILAQLRSGHSDRALKTLYRHLPPIRRMIRYYGGDRQQAEDIFQEALIVLCRKAVEPGFSLSAGIYPFLYSACRFMWYEEQRRSARQPVAELVHDAEDTAHDLAVMLEEEARYRAAEKIVDGLADRCRELLQLFYSGGMKLRDIASRMGYGSEQSAKNQKYKCLEAAREQYRQLQHQSLSL